MLSCERAWLDTALSPRNRNVCGSREEEKMSVSVQLASCATTEHNRNHDNSWGIRYLYCAVLPNQPIQNIITGTDVGPLGWNAKVSHAVQRSCFSDVAVLSQILVCKTDLVWSAVCGVYRCPKWVSKMGEYLGCDITELPSYQHWQGKEY